jgi:hypothetical protein
VKNRARGHSGRVKFLVCCLSLLALASLSAQARLGETEEQLVDRFGSGSHTPKFWDDLPGVTYILFSKQNFSIYVGLLNGKSAYERYQTDRGVSDELIRQLLVVESEGHKWSPPQTWPSVGSGRLRDDGAIAYAWNSAFIFKSKEYAEKESAREKMAEDSRQPRIDGF